MTIAVISTIFAGLYVYNMGKDFLPDFDEGATQLNLFAPPGTSLSASLEISKQANRKLKQFLQTDENPEWSDHVFHLSYWPSRKR